MKKIILIVAAAFALTAGAAASDFLGGSFIDDGLAARALGMGGAYTAVADDANASFWNPAGMALFGKEKSMSFTYVPDAFALTDSKMSRALISYGQGDTQGYGAVGGSISYLSINIAADGRGEQEYGWTEYVALISWAMQIDKYMGFMKYSYPKAAIGINVKYLGLNTDLMLDTAAISASGFGADVGLLFAPKDNFKLGFMAKDVYTQVSWGSGTSERIPYTLRGGIFYGITAGFLVSFEVKASENGAGSPEIEQYCIGTEYAVDFGKRDQIQKVAVRGGITLEPANDAYIIAGGASMYMDNFAIDYTYQHFIKIFLGNTHRFGLTLDF